MIKDTSTASAASTSPTRKIRWGVLGYARIAQNSLIPAMQRSSNSTFHAIASRDAAKLAACREKFATASSPIRAHASYDALLADPEVDAVYIPLPNSLHREWTIKAAQAGKHVLCEKPIALNAAEAREMIAACAAAKVTLMEAFMYRYTQRTRIVLEIIRGGALGEIRHIESTFRFLLANPASTRWRPEYGGGALYDVGVYPLNFIGMVMDAATNSAPGASPAPVSVSVQCTRDPRGIDDNLSALLRYPNGVIAAAHCGFNSGRRAHSTIAGSKGVLEIPDTFFDTPAPLALTLATASAAGENDARAIPVPASDRYRSEVEDFAASLLENRAPLFPLAETLRNAELLDRLMEASRERGACGAASSPRPTS